jgi:hypothetical protein
MTRRRRLYALLAALAVGSVGAGVSATYAASTGAPASQLLILTADLTADQVVAGSTSTATGQATVQIDPAVEGMETLLNWSGLTGPADRAHVHSGLKGQPTDGFFFHEVINDQDRTVPCPWQQGFDACVPASGGLLDDQFPGGAGNYNSYDDFLAAARSGGLYIDMHTEQYPLGEIRGQLLPAAYQPPSGFLAPAANSTLHGEMTVSVKFVLTDVNGVRISDALAAQLLSPLCKVHVFADGVQPLAATCVRYESVPHQFVYRWKLRKAPGAETISILVEYPNFGVTTSESVTIK